MRVLIITIACLINFNVFSQKIKAQYFLINENDTLIKRQVSTKNNMYQGYKIINEDKIIKRYVRSAKIDDNDIEVNAFDSLSFTFDADNDTIVNDSYIKTINFIKDRREFFKVNIDVDETKNRFIFIIPIKCNKFILRKVRPIISE